MKQMKWIFFALLILLAAGSFTLLLAVDEARQAYDRMVEESTREADDYLEQKQKEQNAAAAQAGDREATALDAKVQAESERIRAEMDTLRNRGLGPNFTQGMKDNQLQQLQDRLNRLVSNPEAYFGE